MVWKPGFCRRTRAAAFAGFSPAGKTDRRRLFPLQMAELFADPPVGGVRAQILQIGIRIQLLDILIAEVQRLLELGGGEFEITRPGQ